MLDHITPMVGQVEGQQQDYGQDQDENATAIQTITITSDHLGEFTQQLQTVSSQLQATSDIGEVYIQGKHSGPLQFCDIHCTCTSSEADEVKSSANSLLLSALYARNGYFQHKHSSIGFFSREE